MKIERALPAIATQPVKAGQTVGLIVKEGITCTFDSNSPVTEAKEIAMTDAAVGEDLGAKELARQNET
jgi:predicted transcriptional regulator